MVYRNQITLKSLLATASIAGALGLVSVQGSFAAFASLPQVATVQQQVSALLASGVSGSNAASQVVAQNSGSSRAIAAAIEGSVLAGVTPGDAVQAAAALASQSATTNPQLATLVGQGAALAATDAGPVVGDQIAAAVADTAATQPAVATAFQAQQTDLATTAVSPAATAGNTAGTGTGAASGSVGTTGGVATNTAGTAGTTGTTSNGSTINVTLASASVPATSSGSGITIVNTNNNVNNNVNTQTVSVSPFK